ncbi:MAG TPA: SHOCT domain-containing protein [Ilumatobacteraceae bacterium]
MPGLLRGVARTAVVAGTATAVSNRVSRRQANRWSQQNEPQPQYAQQPQQPQQPQYYEAPPQYAPPPAPAPAAAPADDTIERLKQLAELRDQGILTEEEFTAAKAKVLAG